MNKRLIITIMIISSLFIAGCDQSTFIPTTSPTKLIEQNNIVNNDISTKIEKIGNILDRPELYIGREILIEGKIVSECGSGCWFTLDDGTGILYVDLAPSNLVIPQKRGASARVYGKVTKKGSDTYLIGTKVEF